MIFNFEFMEEEIIQVDIILGNTTIQSINLPSSIAKFQIKELIMKIANDSRPMYLKCTKAEETDSGRVLNNSFTFYNNTYVKSKDM